MCAYPNIHRCKQSETGNRGWHSAPDSQIKSVSISLCSFPLLFCVSILSSSALRLSCVYLTQRSAKPAIAFEQRQRFWRSYRPGWRWRGLSMAKGRLTSSTSFPPQVIYYSRLHLVSGQQVDSWPPRLIHLHISRHIRDSHYDKAHRGPELTAVINTESFTQHL